MFEHRDAGRAPVPGARWTIEMEVVVSWRGRKKLVTCES